MSSTHKPVVSLKVTVALAHEGQLGINNKEDAVKDDTDGEEPGSSIVEAIVPRKENVADSSNEQRNNDSDGDGLNEPHAAAFLHLGRRERDVDGDCENHASSHNGPRAEIEGVLELSNSPHHADHPAAEGYAREDELAGALERLLDAAAGGDDLDGNSTNEGHQEEG